MRRSARIFVCGMAALGGVAAMGTGAASAAPATPAAATIAAHGLGARPPSAATSAGVSARAVSNAMVAVPASVDLRRWAVTPGDQGALNSCVPWAVDYGMLGWYSRFSGLAGQPFAPMYTYSQINGGGDYGSSATAALQVAVDQGNDTRAHYPQGDSNWSTVPTAAERVNAARYKIKGFSTIFIGTGQLTTPIRLKQALATNHPVAIEMAVRNGFDLLAAGATAVDDDSTSAIRGYHEVLAVGYDAAGLIVQNSWGTEWANGGFGRISWRVVLTDVGEGEIADGFVQAVTAPSVSTPVAARASTATAVHTIVYKATWKGTVGNSGAITRYEASYQVDGRPFVAVKLSSSLALSFRVTTVIGHRYRVAVRAVASNQVGAFRYVAFVA